MTSIVKPAMANILFNKLMATFDDIEGFSQIATSQEYRILLGMQELENELNGAKDRSAGTTDTDRDVGFELVVGAWNKFHEKVTDLSERHKTLLENLTELHEVNSPAPFLLFGSLINHEAKLIQTLDAKSKEAFRMYVDEGNAIIRDLRVGLLAYHAADLVDEFIDDADIIDQENIHYRRIELGGTIVYPDQNTVTAIRERASRTQNWKRDLQSNKVKFVYSAYLIEDSINMNPFFLKEFLSDLSDIAGNQMIGTLEEGIGFVSEDIRSTISRVEKYSRLTKKFEAHRFATVIRHYHDYPQLRRGRALYNAVGEDPVEFFRRDSKEEIEGFNQVLNEFSGRDMIADFIRTGHIKDTALDDKGQLIEDLMELFDFINFKTEAVKLSNAAKIGSSHRDIKHLAHAFIADYFVTDDERLKARAKIIYPLIGAHTQVVGLKEFLELFPTLL